MLKSVCCFNFTPTRTMAPPIEITTVNGGFRVGVKLKHQTLFNMQAINSFEPQKILHKHLQYTCTRSIVFFKEFRALVLFEQNTIVY